MAKTLAEYNPAETINLLNERLVFERAGVQLYDKILEAMQGSGDENIMRMYPQMVEYRNDEDDHVGLLESLVRDLGGDVQATTELSELIQKEVAGIKAVVMSDPELPHLFHALLAAELVDNAGWELLMELADEAGDWHAKRVFKTCLREEEDHLRFIQEAVEKLAIMKVLGRPETMPAAP